MFLMDLRNHERSLSGSLDLMPREAVDRNQQYFDASTKSAIRIVAAISSSLSLTAILVTFAYFSLMPKRLLRHKLIMLNIFGSFVRASWYFIFAMVVISGVDVPTPSAFCQATGFFLNVGNQITDISVLLIAIHGALRVFRPRMSVTDKDILERWQTGIYIATLVLPPAVTALAFINTDAAFTAQGPFCFLPNSPIWYRLTLSWLLRYIVSIVIVVLSTAVYVHVGFEFRKYDRAERDLSYGRRTTSRDSTMSGSDWDEPASPGFATPQSLPASPSLLKEQERRKSSAWWSHRPNQQQVETPGPQDELGMTSFPTVLPPQRASQVATAVLRRPSIAGVMQDDFAPVGRRPSAVSFVSTPAAKDVTTLHHPPSQAPGPRVMKRAKAPGPLVLPARNEGFDIEKVGTPTDLFGRYNDSSVFKTSPTRHESPPISPRSTARPPLPDIPSSQTLNSVAPFNPTAEDPSPRSSLTVSRRRLRRQLRLIFIYPILYIVMWIVPFISYVLTYTDRFGTSPPPVLQALATFSVTIMGLVDCGVFVWRERLWVVAGRAQRKREKRRKSLVNQRGRRQRVGEKIKRFSGMGEGTA